MALNMKDWVAQTIASPEKKPLPILSFPSVQLLGISVRELISQGEAQARGMKCIANRVDASAAVSLMDLSVEAEAFGSTVRFQDNEVPTVVGAIVTEEEEADALEVPPVGAGRTGVYLEAIRKALELIQDRPVLAGIIGPYSLAGRLLDVSEAMVLCYEEPDMVHTVMEKTTRFLIDYALSYKAAGANGVVMAEPLTGILSPGLAREFSAPYVKQIVRAVQDEHFLVMYHNCGNNVPLMLDAITDCGAMAFHFGNAVDLGDILPHMPGDCLVLGNVDPAGVLKNGTPDTVTAAVQDQLTRFGSWPNYVLSSGCDIPPLTPWENIDAFFAASRSFVRQ